MTASSVDRVASALLYEGYILYPYRRSAVKNRHRFNFGVIYPAAPGRARDDTDPTEMQTECLLAAATGARLDVAVRFLHLFARPAERADAPEWHDAVEREIAIRGLTPLELARGGRRERFAFPAAGTPGRQLPLAGEVELGAEPVGEDVFRVRVRIANRTPVDGGSAPARDEMLLRCLVSAHTILRAAQGEFLSLIDPPPGLAPAAAACRNVGTWPVLAGEDGARDTLLSSPIILYDFPSVAPESPGDFFDGTEMDEMLSLRILTLTDEEKREMAGSDERARRLLQRTEACDERDLMRMHGVLRQLASLEEFR